MCNVFRFRLLFRICLFFSIIFVPYAHADTDTQPHFSISPLSAALQQKLITAGLWHSGCPVALADLRLVSISYYDFAGMQHNDGAIILNKSAAPAALHVFETLYAVKFPFAAIDPLIQFQANWRIAEQKNTTYGFICIKNSTGKFLNESYGTVITVNPVQNPELIFFQAIQKKNYLAHLWCKLLHPDAFCKETEIVNQIIVFPPAGILSINRSLKLNGMAEDAAETFEKYGFTSWGGQKTDTINWKKFVFHANGAKR